jgi:hypothetical protein
MTPTAHYYKQARAHQAKVIAEGGGMLTRYESGRTEKSYASAPYGEHALSAFMAAKRSIHFRKSLAKGFA